MCRVEDEEQQYLNATANTTATTTTTAENGAAVVFPGAMQSSSLLSTSPNREPSWAEEADDDYLALLRKSPKGSNEDNNIIAAINEHACQTMQSCYSCSCSCMARTTSPARFITRAFLSLLLVGITVIVCLWRSGMDILQSVVHLSISMGVMHHYESNIYTEHFRSFLDKNIRPLITPDYLPFLLNNNTLLCPKAYREFIISGRPRERAALEMMHTGLELELSFRKDVAKRRKRRDPLPILIINRDESGCNTRAHHDIYDFPRLTWSVPALKHHMEWCKAVPIPSYEIWKDFSKKHTSEESWDATFALKSEQYPWENKSNLALWRGTTTYDLNYTGHDLNDTPRGRLVRLSMNHPNLIDAGFVKLNQQYENATFTDENRPIVTERMKFDDMMKYKAIIDIDGNDWSSRFPKLLCMNSVVIKVCCVSLMLRVMA